MFVDWVGDGLEWKVSVKNIYSRYIEETDHLIYAIVTIDCLHSLNQLVDPPIVLVTIFLSRIRYYRVSLNDLNSSIDLSVYT